MIDINIKIVVNRQNKRKNDYINTLDKTLYTCYNAITYRDIQANSALLPPYENEIGRRDAGVLG